MLNAAAESFLWSLFRLGLVEGDPDRAIERVSSLYDGRLDLPEKFDRLITDYWASRDRTVLLSLAITTLESFCLDVDHQTRLTAYLFTHDEIELNQAYAYLSFDGVNVDDLQPSVRRVADVHWLLRQDVDACVMEPINDDLLSEALRDLAREG